MKKVIIICNKTFLRGPAQLTMIYLTILLTSREWSPAIIFVQLGWDTGWGGHLAPAEPTKFFP